MTREEFIRLAETWGGDMSRWPMSAQDRARDFAATEDGEKILQVAEQFDQQISIAPHVEQRRADAASLAVLRRIAAAEKRLAAPRFARVWPGAWLRAVSQAFPRPWALPAASLACSLLIGMSLGAIVPPTRHSDGPQMPLDLILDTGFTPLWGSR
jgi:hypothetical protein